MIALNYDVYNGILILREPFRCFVFKELSSPVLSAIGIFDVPFLFHKSIICINSALTCETLALQVISISGICNIDRDAAFMFQRIIKVTP